jgi:hypothetical protein
MFVRPGWLRANFPQSFARRQCLRTLPIQKKAAPARPA